MRYKRQGHARAYRLRIPALTGGLNTAAPETLIEDNELTDVCNLRLKNQTLIKRPALVTHNHALATYISADTDGHQKNASFDSVCAHPFEVDGELCTVLITAANYGSGALRGRAEQYVQVVTLDGDILHTYTIEDWLVRDMAVAPCDRDTYGCAFLLYGGNSVYKPNDVSNKMEQIPDEELYAPLVLVNGKGAGTVDSGGIVAVPGRAVTGVMYEGFNTLTRRYRARFTTGAGTRRESFFLPTALHATQQVELEVITAYGTVKGTFSPTAADVQTIHIGDGTERSVTIVPAEGRVDITPSFPVSTVSDNLTITCYADSATVDSTRGATIAAWFGGTQNRLGGTRLFLAGFSKEKAKVMWSDVNNPLYFPENNYMYVGDLSQRVTALEKQEDMLVIFKERELYYTTYVQGSIDEETVANGLNVDVTVSQAYFPLTQLSPYIGCDCPQTIVVCRNRLVWLCKDARIYTLIIGSQYSERNVREIGTKIREHIVSNTTETERSTASAMDHNGCYVVMIGHRAYSFDYSASGFVYLTSYASNDSLMKNIAWFVHRFDGIVAGEHVQLVSDGAYRAIAIGTRDIDERVCMARMVYRFVDEAWDDTVRMDVSETSPHVYAVNVLVTRLPIAATLTTKAFDCSDAAAFKRIAALFLSATATELYVRFIADGKTDNEQKRVSLDGNGAHLVMPSVKRCRTLAIRLDCDQPLIVNGLQLQYTVFGAVR